MRRAVAAGAVAALALAGCVLGAALRPADGATASPLTAQLPFRLVSGEICTLDLRVTTTGTGDPAARRIAQSAVAAGGPPPAALPSGRAPAGQIAAYVDDLESEAERSVERMLGARVDVAIDATPTCAHDLAEDGGVGPVLGDAGRTPTDDGGRDPDVVGFFQASTGVLCEVQVTIDAAAGAGDEEALPARAWLAAVDLEQVDLLALMYAAELDAHDAAWWIESDVASREARVLSRYLAQGALDAGAAAGHPNVTGRSWGQCSP